MVQKKMKRTWQTITPDCLNLTGGVDVTFLVLVTNTVQIILQTFEQRDEKFLCILLTAHIHKASFMNKQDNRTIQHTTILSVNVIRHLIKSFCQLVLLYACEYFVRVVKLLSCLGLEIVFFVNFSS